MRRCPKRNARNLENQRRRVNKRNVRVGERHESRAYGNTISLSLSLLDRLNLREQFTRIRSEIYLEFGDPGLSQRRLTASSGDKTRRVRDHRRNRRLTDEGDHLCDWCLVLVSYRPRNRSPLARAGRVPLLFIGRQTSSNERIGLVRTVPWRKTECRASSGHACGTYLFCEKKRLPDSSSSSSSCTKYLSSRVQIRDGHVPKYTCRSTQINVRTVLPPASLFKAPHGSGAGNALNFTNKLSKFCYLRDKTSFASKITEIILRYDTRIMDVIWIHFTFSNINSVV